MQKLTYKHIEEALNRPLLGWDAQNLMAPTFRQEEIEDAKNNIEQAGKSAVLILVYEKNGSLHIPVIRRAVYRGAHSGQISFPGGKVEKSDVSYQETALRETYEEIGIDAKKVKIVGQLSDLYIPPSNFMVKTFVGFLFEPPLFIPDYKEVQRIIEIPLFTLFNKEIIKEKTFTSSSSGVRKKAPYFDVENVEIWGATAMILSELIETIR